ERVDVAAVAGAALHAQAAIVTAALHASALAVGADLAGGGAVGYAHARLLHVAGRVPAAQAVGAGVDLPWILRVAACVAGLAVAEERLTLRLHPTSFLCGPEVYGVAATVCTTTPASVGKQRIARVPFVLLVAAIVDGHPV